MLSFRCRALVVVVLPILTQLGAAQSAQKPPRDPLEKLSERDLLPKMTDKPRPWRPQYSIDDVPEIRFEEPLHPCLDTASAARHREETLQKIRRLDRLKPNGLLRAIEKHRPDLHGLPFQEGNFAAMLPERQNHHFEADRALTQIDVGFFSLQPQKSIFSQLLVAERVTEKSPRAKRALRSNEEFEAIAQLAKHRYFTTDADSRLMLVQILLSLPIESVNRTLAGIAIYAPESEVRDAAIAAIRVRRGNDDSYSFTTASLTTALRYPLPTVVRNAADALIALKIDDDVTLELLAETLEADPLETDFRRDDRRREVVKINHHRNCMLCHPASPINWRDRVALNANVPNPREKLPDSSVVPGGYDGGDLKDAIRFDIAYLFPDFSLTLSVDEDSLASAWPKMQRFDFLVRDRQLTPKEQADYERALPFLPPSATRTETLRVLQELTGGDAEPTKAAWLRVIAEFNKKRQKVKSAKLN